tara:strand:- start:39 stop:785 length:747 start_codon:yes stop_codon:yes gene_type:complete
MSLEISLKNYSLNGFVVLKNVFSHNDVKKILLDLDVTKELLKKTKDKKFFHKTKDDKINTIHNVQEFYKKNKIKSLVKKKELSLCIKNILGKSFKIRNIEFFLKPKKTGMPSPFHQDNFYWNIENAEALNVWIALTKSNKNNGGLCYLKESHNLGTIKHEISFAKGSSQKIPNKILNKLNFNKNFPVLKKGDCLIHHPEVIHGSFSNKSNFDRSGVVVSFLKSTAKIDQKKMNNYKKNVKKNLKNIYL